MELGMNELEERVTRIISSEHLTSAVKLITELVREESVNSYEEGYRFAKEESVKLNNIVEVLS